MAYSSSASKTSHIPVIRTLAQLRRWRQQARESKLEVGIVPTMGALHEGHLNLGEGKRFSPSHALRADTMSPVKTSLHRHPLTVMTLFVNPMQFAPHEDLSAYPRTLEKDLDLLRTLLPTAPTFRGLGVSENDSFRSPSSSSSSGDRAHDSPLIVFAPGNEVLYPLKGELQDLEQKKGVEVDVKGWGEVMEGSSRPQFFKGVATICTKLFNAVEPDHAYFGQKDIQQALLLKISAFAASLSAPPRYNPADALRNSVDGSPPLSSLLQQPPHPPDHAALSAARGLFETAASAAPITGEELISEATKVILEEQQRILDEGEDVELKLDYVEVFEKSNFEPMRGEVRSGRELVVAGAMWVGKTRLIDNLLLGWEVD
ncbi:pantoate--beta-alanine ligase, partial [Tremellales sp. Uapishka_1]